MYPVELRYQSFIAAICCRIRHDNFPVVGHNQQRCPTGGQEDFGTADDGVTDAVLVVDLAVDLRVLLLLFAPPSFSF